MYAPMSPRIRERRNAPAAEVSDTGAVQPKRRYLEVLQRQLFFRAVVINTEAATDGPVAIPRRKGKTDTRSEVVAVLRHQLARGVAIDGNLRKETGRKRVVASLRQVERSSGDVIVGFAVAAFPPYADYQTRTTRQIPVFLAEA